MAVLMSNCGHDENGRYSGGAAGDQSGTEWYLPAWFQYPYGGWNYVIRFKDYSLGCLMADLAIEAANNNKIGYDQWQRDTFWQQLSRVGYRPKNITVACEADCSAGVIALIRCIGYLKGISEFKNISCTYTGNMIDWFKKYPNHFQILSESKYLNSSNYCRKGDIYLNVKNHTNTCVSNGAYANLTSTTTITNPEAKGYLCMGDNGTAVKTMQTMLIKCGYSCGTSGADGDFGSYTLAAVKAFQKANGLEVDGSYGPLTKAALTAKYNSLSAPKPATTTTPTVSANKLYLIAGHGAGDPGSCANGHQEAERVRALCSKIKAYGGDNVVYLDPSINYYASNKISSLTIPKGSWLLECHMDWWETSSPKGGHVVIASGVGGADKYDTALANMLKKYLPGRAEMVTPRSDLANPNRAKAKGFNYRLVEFGFISNAGDLNWFNTNIDLLAKEVLACFGLGANASATTTSTTKPATTPVVTSTKLVVDGAWGTETTKRLQQIFKTTVDGVVSNQWAEYKSKNPGLTTGWEWKTRPNGQGSQLVKAIQKWAGMTGSNVDGEIGDQTIKAIQRKLGTTADGYLSNPSDCVKALQKWANNQ